MRCALLQLCSETDPEAGARDVADLMDGLDAEFVLTPEMTPLLQKDPEALRAAVADEATTAAPFQALARQHGVHLLLGSAAVRREDGRIANRSLLIGPNGTIRARYDKINLFEASLANGETYREADTYAAGTEPALAYVGGLRVGLTICYDVRFPALFSAYGGSGAHVITVPAAFTRSTGRDHWETLLRARAIETGAWVLAPAQGGLHADGRRTWGRTTAVSPWGEISGCLDHDRPGVLAVDIDARAVDRARARIPAWRQRGDAPISPA